MRDKPYFMENEEWYYLDPTDEECAYKLTDKAPQEAVDSYNEFVYGKPVFGDSVPEEKRNYQFD